MNPTRIDIPEQHFVSIADALTMADRHRAEGHLIEAEALCRKVLKAQPDSAEAVHLLGLIAHHNGDLAQAIEHVERASKLGPGVALFHANLGEMLRLAGRPRDAAEAARRALAVDPQLAPAWCNLGVALYELKDYEQAAGAQRKAIATNPNYVTAYSNLGNALHALRRHDEAIASYRRALSLDPSFADAWANLGTTLHHSGDFDEGIAALRRAVALAPDHANAHSGLGILLLMRGDFAEGWEEYEWRLRSTERKGPRFPERAWSGDSLAGRHIYVQGEQGFGDTLQFARYLPLLAKRAGAGGRVTLRVQQPLVTLLRESLPNITVLGDRGEATPYHCDAALLSLPRLLRTRLETIPAAVPYLRVPHETAQRWTRRLRAMPGLKIGLVWAGNPEHSNNFRRSIDFRLLAPILDVQGASFASLQVGACAADLEAARGRSTRRKPHAVEDFSRDLKDFDDTAGAVAALDLVITVDTSVAHLAGALGKPVWVLLPWVTDWRWMLEREDNPWYRTMRLFRQKQGEDDWSAVIAAVTQQVQAVVAGDTSGLMPFKAVGERRAVQAAEIIAAEAAHAVSANVELPAAMRSGQALILAEQKRRHGFIGDADELARGAASAEPENAEAAHMLAILAHQSGKAAEAIEHVRRAIAIKPDVALYHANLGEMCRLAGRTDEAIAEGRRALELNPNLPQALSNLGIALFEKQQFEEALTLQERAVALQPDFRQAHSNRGNVLQRLKRFAEAEPCYRRAIELEPSFPEAYNNLGTALRELGRFDEAEAAYRKALTLQPSDPETLDNLALTLQDLGRREEAVELLRRALSIEERDSKIHLHYGALLLDQGRLDEAADAAERARALTPHDYDVINLMGRVAFERGDQKRALDHYRNALALNPDRGDAHNNAGIVLLELGRTEEARQAFLAAVTRDPKMTGAYANLADSIKFGPGDPHLAAMEALAKHDDGLTSTDKMHLHYALGKAYADIREHRCSFEHLARGAAIKRARIIYDEPSVLALFDGIKRTFTAELIAAKSGAGDPTRVPIFVLGMPRSGTTLIEQILASHPDVYGAGELKTLNDVVIAAAAASESHLPYPAFVPSLDHAAIRKVGSRYLALLRERAPQRAHVTDKMPSNYFFAGLIHLVLPNATIIHAVRDPVDTCISCFTKLFAAEQNHTYDLAELGRYYRRYAELMVHWHNVLPAGRILAVRYEDVVDDLEGQARRIIAHCGLAWDPRCLSFHRTERPVRTASATQVRQPIYRNAVGRWRVYEEYLGPLLAALAD